MNYAEIEIQSSPFLGHTQFQISTIFRSICDRQSNKIWPSNAILFPDILGLIVTLMWIDKTRTFNLSLTAKIVRKNTAVEDNLRYALYRKRTFWCIHKSPSTCVGQVFQNIKTSQIQTWYDRRPSFALQVVAPVYGRLIKKTHLRKKFCYAPWPVPPFEPVFRSIQSQLACTTNLSNISC